MLGEVKRSTWPASRMWYATPSNTRYHQWFGAVCNAICLRWYQKQDLGRHDGCEIDSSKEKHSPTCAWLGQSPSAPCPYKLSCIFAEALQATKSPVPISHGWHLVNGLCLLSIQHSLYFPNPCRYLTKRWTVVVKAGKVRTLILTDVVYTVDHVVIANRIMRANKRCIRIV